MNSESSSPHNHQKQDMIINPIQVKLSQYSRNANKDKTELQPMEQNVHYLSAPHVHKILLTNIDPSNSKRFATEPIEFVLLRRVFRGEMNVSQVLVQGKKWTPVQYSQGPRGQEIPHAISVKKEYEDQEWGNRLFDIQFLVNSFNTSREPEFSSFIIQVQFQKDHTVLFTSPSFRLRARNEIHARKRKVVCNGELVDAGPFCKKSCLEEYKQVYLNDE